MQEKQIGTQSISRALTLLQLFDDEKPRWELPDIVEASGLTRTTVFRMLQGLEVEGMIQRFDSGEYGLGAELIALGGRAMRANRFREIAHPLLRHLTRETTESTTLDILLISNDGLPQSMVIYEAIGHHLLGMTQYICVRFPAHTTSTGKALLAYQPADLLADLIPRQLSKLTEHTITDQNRLLDELITVRQNGYALAIHELEFGIMAVAAPIFGPHGEAQAAISIGGPASRISVERLHQLGQLVKKTAMAVSTRIGFRPNRLKPPGGS